MLSLSKHGAGFLSILLEDAAYSGRTEKSLGNRPSSPVLPE